jgi:CRP-like cAMP-binding protein
MESNKDFDTRQVVQCIGILAGLGRFKEAEVLRDAILQLHPGSVQISIDTEKIIEDQKTKQLNPVHLKTWAKLYNGLNSEERNGLFYSLKSAKIPKGKVLLMRGRPNNRLFFIENGTVLVFYRKTGDNIPIIELKRGDILGEDTFFESSHSTFSATTTSEVHLRHLNRTDMQQWKQTLPMLENKLVRYCGEHGKIEAALHKKKLDRRAYARYQAAGTVVGHVLDASGNYTANYFRGELLDISRSGLSVLVRAPRKEHVLSFVDKNIEVNIGFEGHGLASYQGSGTVVRVKYRMFTDYQVFIKFQEVIDATRFRAFHFDWNSREQ